MKQKSERNQPDEKSCLADTETKYLGQLPCLVEHCSCRRYDDGKPRQPGWFTVKSSGSAWIVQVKDPDSCLSFSVVADTLDKALESCELLLSCDEAPWEHDKFLTSMNGRRRS